MKVKRKLRWVLINIRGFTPHQREAQPVPGLAPQSGAGKAGRNGIIPLKGQTQKPQVLNRGAGFTLVELLVVIAIIAILALIGVPEISRFSADYKVRTCATDLIQNMKVAKAMAIKENREYLVTFDTTAVNQRYMIGFSNNDGDLLDLDLDTFGLCKDTDVPPDRLPNGDVPHSAPNADVPECVKVINLNIQCGSNVSFNTLAPIGPDTDGLGPNPPNALCVNGEGVCFGASAAPIRTNFNPDGTIGNIGSVYFQHTERGYSYVTIVSFTTGAMNIWKWDGDIDNQSITNWTELR